MNHFDSITHSGTPGISDFSSWMVNSQRQGLLNSQIPHSEDPTSGYLSIKSPDCGSSHSSQCRVVLFSAFLMYDFSFGASASPSFTNKPIHSSFPENSSIFAAMFEFRVRNHVHVKTHG